MTESIAHSRHDLQYSPADVVDQMLDAACIDIDDCNLAGVWKREIHLQAVWPDGACAGTARQGDPAGCLLLPEIEENRLPARRTDRGHHGLEQCQPYNG